MKGSEHCIADQECLPIAPDLLSLFSIKHQQQLYSRGFVVHQGSLSVYCLRIRHSDVSVAA